MKKRLLTILLLFVAILSLQAQRQETLRTTARNKGGFGGLYFVSSQADGDPGGGAGFDGAFIRNDWFFGGFIQAESFDQRRINNRNYRPSLFFTGPWVGYAYPSHKLIHLYTSLRLGWGGAVLNRQDNDPFDNDDYSDFVFVFAPEIGAEINAVSWLRIAATLGYRSVSNLSGLPGYSARDFNSPTFAISLRAGAFGYK
ncbi:MAG: hypothetical protein L6Q97_19975 [Thermoanaerobaculia bacterium]|nr:hypothetical protein [Thermoanaerobaculia bacterium]